MFNFFKRSKQKQVPKWENLSPETKKSVTRKLASTIKNMIGARYKLVSGMDELQREQGVREYKNEDEILNSTERGKLLNLARNAYRNNPQLVTILKQFDLHGIGTVGGKTIITFPNKDFGKRVRDEFAKWTRSSDFFDGLNLNSLLKIILKSEMLGGDLVLVFDDNLVSDSGKILLFESDEMGNCQEDVLLKHYGVNATQSLGRVKNKYSQFVGAIVSKSQRGQDVFEEDKSYFLKRDPDGNVLDDLWLMPRNVFRISQGRGVSPLSSSLSTLIDINDYVGFELAAAKKNSQTIAQITQSIQEQAELPSAFDENMDFSSMTDEQIEQAAKSEIDDVQEKTVSLDKINAAGVIYQVIPEGYKMDLLDTKHPNINSCEFVRWLASFSAAPFGLTKQYATLTVDSSYSGFKGEQQMVTPAFEEAQKFLEQICDWILYRWSIWAVRKGVIENNFEDGWLRNVNWEWPVQKDIDEVKNQNAINLKLKNFTSNYKEILGADWQEKLQQAKSEMDWCKENGIVHPSQITVSGGVVEIEQDNGKENQI